MERGVAGLSIGELMQLGLWGGGGAGLDAWVAGEGEKVVPEGRKKKEWGSPGGGWGQVGIVG